MKWSLLAIAAVNLALAAFLLRAIASRETPQGQNSQQTPAIAAGESGQAPGAKTANTADRQKRLYRETFHWQTLQSGDLKLYAGNLRAVQCPEETIRDILLAEIGRRYASREQELKARPRDLMPWESVPSYEKKNSETQLRQVLAEKRAAIKEILGTDAPASDMPPKLAGRNLENFESAFNSLPASKREEVRAIQEKYWTQSDEIKSRTMGFLEPEDREAYKRIKSERREEMAKILTPQELEDYEMRTSPTGTALRSRTDGFKPTEEEFRAIFRATQPLDEEYSLISGTFDKEDKALLARRAEAEKQWQEDLRTALGDERYAEMERSRDKNYRNIETAGREAGLPKEAIVQIYETQKTLQTEMAMLFKDAGLSPEQRATTAAQLQAQAEGLIRSAAGDRAGEILQKIGTSQGVDPALMKRYGILPSVPGEPGQPVRLNDVVIPVKP